MSSPFRLLEQNTMNCSLETRGVCFSPTGAEVQGLVLADVVSGEGCLVPSLTGKGRDLLGLFCKGTDPICKDPHLLTPLPGG